MSENGPATCVITVDTGPGGIRWALVSLSPDADEHAGPVALTRLRLRGSDEVLAAVARFLADAGLAG